MITEKAVASSKDTHALDFAKRDEIPDKVEHLFGTRLEVIYRKMQMLVSLSPGGDFPNPVLLEKNIAKGLAISQDEAKRQVLELIKQIEAEPELGEQRVQEAKEYWYRAGKQGGDRGKAEGAEHQARVEPQKAMTELLGEQLGDPNNPWDPFAELGIQ